MTRAIPWGLWLGASCLASSPGLAQLGELQAGVVGSYGTSAAYGPGAGLVLGVATGRLAYVGLRWVYHRGDNSAGVTNRVQTFTTDLGVMLPAGPFDLMPGVSFGVARFAQRAGGARTRNTEFLAAPGIAAEVHIARVALIPELRYDLAGDPELAQPVRHRGLVASLRFIVPIEVGRIRR